MIQIEGTNEHALLKSISRKREEMIQVASLRGIKNKETVMQSKELDMLIILYQRHMLKI
ncbi:Spo0E like sporulation regulatory protein [Scopulibacillus darangshiensis]|uniref:Spo0E like sporulation regulatory protein n=1 Tax=Scopulibacillus darangshiensis TaxID=442528 RepID=A0A4R2NFE0_9BACL|nr:aspartyl-phosphate phosphatase Spo0E family protein [Scopulibacillus darangshiensis]TCP19977.1 Spo0E like sporulation regulatory protein [Scopulibacillus darangshiensis]